MNKHTTAIAYIVVVLMFVITVMMFINLLFDRLDTRTQYYKQSYSNSKQYTPKTYQKPSSKQSSCVTYDGNYDNDTCN